MVATEAHDTRGPGLLLVISLWYTVPIIYVIAYLAIFKFGPAKKYQLANLRIGIFGASKPQDW